MPLSQLGNTMARQKDQFVVPITPDGGGTPPAGDVRITEASDRRITEAGDVRILEG